MENRKRSAVAMTAICLSILLVMSYSVSFAGEASEGNNVETKDAYVGYDMKTTASGKRINVWGYSQFWVHKVEVDPDKGTPRYKKGKSEEKIGTLSYDENKFTVFANGTTYGFVGGSYHLERIHYVENGKVRGIQADI